jgi:hypothetical protein
MALWSNQGHRHLPSKSSKIVWDAIDGFGRNWRKLDKYLRDGTHDRLLDRAVSSIRGSNILHPFWYYADGWGDISVTSSFYAWLETFQKEAEAVQKLKQMQKTWLPRKIDIKFREHVVHDGVLMREGTFRTCAHEILHLLPTESLEARALFVSPLNHSNIVPTGPTVVLLAGTGEHGYSRRLTSLAIPLASQSGISSVILESPFYGSRRPRNQVGSKLRRVSDLAVLGRVTIEETSSLLRFLTEESKSPSLAVAGISMGGLHSAMTAALTPLSIGVVSWLGPPSAAPVFTDGLLSRFCEWKRLQNELGNSALAKDVMRRVLGLTDINNFPKPVDGSRGIFVIAQNDLYVPADVSISTWHAMSQDKWKGSRVVVIPGGHVSGALFGAQTLRKCIRRVLNVSQEDPFALNETSNE